MGDTGSFSDPQTWVFEQVPLLLAPLLLAGFASRARRYRPLLLAGAIALLPFTLSAPFTVPPIDLRWDQALDGSARFWLLGFLWSSSLGLGSYLLTVRLLRDHLPRWCTLGLLPLGIAVALAAGLLPQLDWSRPASHLSVLALTALPIWLYLIRNPRPADHD
jgi:hypothetical protein